jgi:HEAT repeat protein
MPRQTLEQATDGVRALRGAVDPSAGLRQALRHKHGFVVAIAADIVRERELHALAADLVTAYGRFFDDPVKRDPGCRAKARIADALDHLDWPDAEPFVRGVGFVQLEPAWGEPEDTAASLRSRCVFALARIGDPEAMVEIAERLLDRVANVRSAAARAIAFRGDRIAGVPLLRLKIGLGDRDPDVVADCMSGLLALAPDQFTWVASRLGDPLASVRQSAALALGESRRPEALATLQTWWKTARGDDRQVALLAIAMLRSAAAIDWLLGMVRAGSSADASDAVAALAVYVDDERVARELAQISATRGTGG